MQKKKCKTPVVRRCFNTSINEYLFKSRNKKLKKKMGSI